MTALETIDEVRTRIERGLEREHAARKGGAAILIPLIPTASGFDVLFEVRALHLNRQPGEVCFPGGHVEPGEDSWKAAIRETCEELLVEEAQLHVVADLGHVDGPGGLPLRVLVGVLEDYAGTFDPEEVDHTFAMPLAWFQEHEPWVYHTELTPLLSDDFPWELIPQGRDYPWRHRKHDIPFYLDSDPLIWGFTARMMHRFVQLLG